MNDYNRGVLPDPCLRLDFGFGEQWESIELGDGTGYVRLSDWEELKAENAKLRYKVHVLENGNKWLQILNNSVEANNAKLRELVRDMMEFFEDGDWCVKCERARDCQAQEQYEDECPMRFVFRDRMRELGIEADS